IEETWIDAREHGKDPGRREAVAAPQVVRRGAGDGYDPACNRAAPEQKEIPERQIVPAEVFGVALVLQVVKYRDLRAAAKDGRGEAGVEQHVEPAADGGQGQHGLLPEEARRTVDGAHGLRDPGEVGLRGEQAGASFG